jgi:excinuclease UvrABC ATPase subunit
VDGPTCVATPTGSSSAASIGKVSGEFIEVVGERENNLKGIHLKLPLGELIVVTDVSTSKVTGAVPHSVLDSRHR